ncbi:twk-5 [Pristionchus pacificus]|uniref:Twk-5 n=1 Tax=Pristionchus pacificus TaxID=54126 RepID=A0A2A6CYL9_PRIPA|nr:twk-5 [Pristionchus pacificus]|eukprot:PDM83186.1 twk-5 [Pristionchus pacificus]
MTHRVPSLWTKFNWLILPQLLLFLGLTAYLIGGVFVFQALDDSLAEKSFNQMLMFEISTLATIGYGDVSPRTTQARAFCIAFSVFGIPLFLLMVANIGKHLTKAFWHLYSCVVGKKQLGALRGDLKMPLFVSLLLFIAIIAIGSETMAHSGDETLVDDVYFSFISFATVGFGDKIPLVDSTLRIVFGLVYIIAGVVAISALFTTFNDWLRKFHYLGRRFRGARDVQVWMGGRSMPVSRLLTIVGEEFNVSYDSRHEFLMIRTSPLTVRKASPREIREVLRDLDCLLLSVAEHQEEEKARKRTLHLYAPLATEEDFDSCSVMDL